MKKKWVGGIIATVILVSAGLYAARIPIAMSVAEKIAMRRLTSSDINLPDGLHVGLCGTGSPMPDPDRSGPCTVVIAGKQLFLFDAGTGSNKMLARMGLGVGALNGVFLTHFHSDHLDGLGEIMMNRWAQQRSGKPLTLYGPQGLKTVYDGFEEAYKLDTGYRIAHHGTTVMVPDLQGARLHEFQVNGDAAISVLREPDLEIDAFAVDHGPVKPAVGYRIRYKGRSVVISGDTAATPQITLNSKNVDLLIHEALCPELVNDLGNWAGQANRPKIQKIMHDILGYHTSPEQVAAEAQEAKVRAVVFTHIIPPIPAAPLREIFMGKAKSIFHGDMRIGSDGDLISLPPNSDRIEYSNILGN
ncbi:MBL fold metallo-hydrolase [Limnobacter litoralis]|uniref:Ribonuclease Z n=1 Tax=Limnobacter litoralis TaxID=481366 RepID=A0ABQ5YKK8_9BURK|nr:MBL fold metallo-hydrolase [Limnobacter litoralis]GLR25070.1 ribonuclease Z [Limnobacter litoralis]